jgi:hypothetical protein
MQKNIDIMENDILTKYPDLLEILLLDHTTGQNIFWATDNYQEYGESYEFEKPILSKLITGENGNIIMPRVKKTKELQKSRSKERAEVFTPSWVCNCQNNLIDGAWFGRENVFNTEIEKSWQTNENKITFPESKTWQDYVQDARLEITCGEAPYLASRYDTTTGEFIEIQNRIGLLDRKLRVINENVDESEKWLKMAQLAYQSTYGFEWQGDNLLLARETLLLTFIENYKFKFSREPQDKSIKTIAEIISWNLWQMDGLKGVIPKSCKPKIKTETNLFSTYEIKTECPGCKTGNIKLHENYGIYAEIKDWNAKNPETGKKGKVIRFIELLKNNRPLALNIF